MEGIFHGGKITEGNKKKKKFRCIVSLQKVRYSIVYAIFSPKENNGRLKKILCFVSGPGSYYNILKVRVCYLFTEVK